LAIIYHDEIEQGSPEWLSIRCGVLTASEMKLIITPTLKVADNDKSRSHLNELLAQRITKFVEPHYISDDMMRGHVDEVDACILYNANVAPLHHVGFVTNDEWGFTIGCSPDALVGDDGLVEVKSRRQKFQVETIITHEMDGDYMIQVQTALLVTRRNWLDFLSFSGGLPMPVIRIWPDAKVQDAIVDAATAFESKLSEKMARYYATVESNKRLIPTVRRVEQEMHA